MGLSMPSIVATAVQARLLTALFAAAVVSTSSIAKVNTLWANKASVGVEAAVDAWDIDWDGDGGPWSCLSLSHSAGGLWWKQFCHLYEILLYCYYNHKMLVVLTCRISPGRQSRQ